MATAKRQYSGGRSRRTWAKVLLLLALGALALAAWFREPIAGKSRAAAAYGARIACSCRFVEGRSIDSCRDDFLPGMGPVMLSEDAEEKSVTARYLAVLASDRARLLPGRGCVLDSRAD